MKKESTYKKEAKAFQKKHSLKLHQAQLLIAQSYSFNTWSDLIKACEIDVVINTPSPELDTKLIENINNEDSVEQVEFSSMSDDIKERTTELEDNIKARVFNNKKKLVSIGRDFAMFEPTSTGLKKSILDATQHVRTLFCDEKFHNYDVQNQGPAYKIIKKAFFISDDGVTETTVSLYRPSTKSGDPRMWFKGLGKFADVGAQIAISIADGVALLINLSTADLHQQDSVIIAKLLELLPCDDSVAQELLLKLKAISNKGLIKATTRGSTAVGMTIEHALGILPNSSMQPDYNGIELKSGRGGKNRNTLFAQVADWQISPLKKSSEILDQFGYYREDDFKLYCTISARKPNSQGLRFSYNEKLDLLIETHETFGDVAVWPGSLLRSRLFQKHKETFWIHAESIEYDGDEYFKLISVTHTKDPMCSQLMPLIRDGIITMDHLIKRRASDGRVSEKGPLFKINKKDLSLIFPEPITYSLAFENLIKEGE